MSPNLILRRPSISLGSWPDHDFDVFDRELKAGRIYRVTYQRGSPWFWGMSFQVIGRWEARFRCIVLVLDVLDLSQRSAGNRVMASF